jgi:hypothetical protein
MNQKTIGIYSHSTETNDTLNHRSVETGYPVRNVSLSIIAGVVGKKFKEAVIIKIMLLIRTTTHVIVREDLLYLPNFLIILASYSRNWLEPGRSKMAEDVVMGRPSLHVVHTGNGSKINYSLGKETRTITILDH